VIRAQYTVWLSHRMLATRTWYIAMLSQRNMDCQSYNLLFGLPVCDLTSYQPFCK